ncbi:MAG: hypothetical protein V1725_03295 [archaeon]
MEQTLYAKLVAAEKENASLDAVRNIVVNYIQNPLMKEVLAGRTTCASIAEKINEGVSGLETLLPLPKNVEHNKLVTHAQALLPIDDCYLTRGVFVPDNVVGIMGSVALFTYLVSYPIEALIGVPFGSARLGLALPLSIAGGGIVGMTQMACRLPKKSLVEKGAYIDAVLKKIE